jgi:drug/metabolite transporter (DMT)-like permease
MVEPLPVIPATEVAKKTGPDRLAIFFALVAVAQFGTAYVAAKLALRELPPFTAATGRFMLSSAILWGILLAQGGPPKPHREDWKALTVAGLFQTTFYFALQYTGLGYTSASNTALIVNARPIFVALLSVFLLHERLGWRKAGGIVVAFAGVVLLITEGSLSTFSLSSSHAFGDALILLNAISGAIGLIFNKRALNHLRVLPTITYTTTVGTLGLIPLAGYEIATYGFRQGTLTSWGAVIYMSIFCSTVPYLFWYTALSRLEASQTAVFLFFVPIISVILSFFILGESVTVYLVIGAVLVLSGAYVTSWANGNVATGIAYLRKMTR